MPSQPPRQNRTILWILGIVLLILLVVLILLQSSNLWKGLTVESAGDTLLLYGLSSLNVAAFVVFGFIFLRSIVKLARERRTLQLGSKIRSRLFFFFAVVSILPIVAMAVFSYLFMNRALDRWFSDIPEKVVRQAREVQNKSNADQHTRLEETAQMLAATLDGRKIDNEDLEELVSTGGLAFAELTDAKGAVIASTVKGPNADNPEMDLVRQGRFSEPSLSDGTGIDVAVGRFSDGRQLVIAPNLRGTESVSQMVDSSLTEFDRLKDQQLTVRQIGFLTLGVLTFLLIFASTWTAFHIARGLTGPIKALAEGAERIAQGDLGYRVEVPAEDELELLIRTFNDMSSKLEANAEELNERRRYIETVLLSLSTGVISLDPEGKITTVNPAARSILNLGRTDLLGIELLDLVEDQDRPWFERMIARSHRVGHASDQAKIETGGDAAGGGHPVALSANALPENRGTVLVIEDLSELIAAQRASAWQEVARRMAHEIKNPLTPIQLSAERIAKKFGSLVNADAVTKIPSSVRVGDDAYQRVVSDGTTTILREVQSLKAMVDEFSRFARLPDVRLESGDVNGVITAAADLYRDRSDEVEIGLQTAADLPMVMIDAEQLKRVFVNLIDNAIEAPRDAEKCVVTLSSRHDIARDIIVIEVADNGRGIDPADYQKLFQPYFSTKGRGTGLGLAIVNRIISEHDGKIKAVPNIPYGARFIIELSTNA